MNPTSNRIVGSESLASNRASNFTLHRAFDPRIKYEEEDLSPEEGLERDFQSPAPRAGVSRHRLVKIPDQI